MAKYRAKVDVPPGIKAGDVVNFQEPLVPGYVPLFDKVSGDEAVDPIVDDSDNSGDPRLTINPDRNELKDRATKLGVVFANNIPTDKLTELVQEAEAKQKLVNGGDDDEKENEE